MSLTGVVHGEVLSELSCTDPAAFPSVHELLYFCECLSWNMLPSLGLYPRKKAPSDRGAVGSGCPGAQGFWHQAEHPSSQTSAWVMVPGNLQLLAQNLQLIGPEQPNILLKQTNVFHQKINTISGNSLWWWFALAVNQPAQWSTAQEGAPREHLRRAQQSQGCPAPVLLLTCRGSLQQTQPGPCNPASLLPSISLPPSGKADGLWLAVLNIFFQTSAEERRGKVISEWKR